MNRLCVQLPHLRHRDSEEHTLSAALSEVEEWLKLKRDWQIKLKEKPLYGLQDQSIRTIEKMREVVREVLETD